MNDFASPVLSGQYAGGLATDRRETLVDDGRDRRISFVRGNFRENDFGDLDIAGWNLSGSDLRGSNLAEVRNIHEATLRYATIDSHTRLPWYLIYSTEEKDNKDGYWVSCGAFNQTAISEAWKHLARALNLHPFMLRGTVHATRWAVYIPEEKAEAFLSIIKKIAYNIRLVQSFNLSAGETFGNIVVDPQVKITNANCQHVMLETACGDTRQKKPDEWKTVNCLKERTALRDELIEGFGIADQSIVKAVGGAIIGQAELRRSAIFGQKGHETWFWNVLKTGAAKMQRQHGL